MTETTKLLASDRERVIGQLQVWLGDLGKTKREIATTEADYDSRREALQREYEAAIKPLQEKRSTLYTTITILVTPNREGLLRGKRTKQIVLPTGKIFWKKSRGKMQFQVSEQEIIDWAAEHRVSAQVVRIKREAMRSKIAKHPKVAGALEMAGLIHRGEGHESLHIEPLKSELDMPDTGKRPGGIISD